MNCRIKLVLLLAVIWCAFVTADVYAADDTVKPLLHPLFADHAVLQRDARVPVWGWANAGAEITVNFAGQQQQAVAGKDGKWLVTLAPMAASTEGRRLEVKSPNRSAQISDVLVGDVWICSGQSNMEMGLGLCKAPGEVAQANYPQIRLLTVPHRISYAPEESLQCAWKLCSPETVLEDGWGGFSAAAYFFGRDLHRELGVPIGLIAASWGGTMCEAWTSREALTPLNDFAGDLKEVAAVNALPGSDKLSAAMEQWYQAKDPGTAQAWHKPETDVAAWRTVSLPAAWAAAGMPGYEGVVWAQRSFEVPSTWAGKDLTLSLGVIADVDTTWLNGSVVGRTDYFDRARLYTVPAALVKPGINVITVRVLNAGGGGFSGPAAQMTIGPAGDQAAPVSLAGPWRIKDTAARRETGAALAGNPNVCTVLYNGMIAPLIPFGIKGAIWYQGEANVQRGYQYRQLLPALIRDWRGRFGAGDFGFHIVSLANYKPMAAEPRDSDWAELREAQALTAKTLPNCGLVVAIDIGDAADIHPRNKQEVGRRLALSALAKSYGKKLQWSGPWYTGMAINGNVVRLRFDHAQSGLAAKGGKLTGFAIAGEDRVFVWADAVIDADSVMVSSPKVAKPVAVRYSWDINPAGNLVNGEQLPAVPFRSDDWPAITNNGGR